MSPSHLQHPGVTERRVPPRTRLASSLRGALIDLYYNSWRFLPANIAFGVALVGLLVGVVVTPYAWVLAVPIIVLAAACMRMATTLVRNGHTDLGEFWDVVRRPWPVIGLGLAQLAVAGMLVADIAIGVSLRSPIGTLLSVMAAYGLIIESAYVVIAWPLVLDPVRAEDPLRRRLKLASLLLVAHPVRFGGLALMLAGLFVASMLAFAAMITVTLALACLVVARYVLPAADRLEGRATLEVAAQE